METIGGFELILPKPVSNFILPNFESITIAMFLASLNLVLKDTIGRVGAVVNLK
jgi:hypothetical protein